MSNHSDSAHLVGNSGNGEEGGNLGRPATVDDPTVTHQDSNDIQGVAQVGYAKPPSRSARQTQRHHYLQSAGSVVLWFALLPPHNSDQTSMYVKKKV